MEPEDENRLFVGKIPVGVPNEDIERHFGRFGTVLHFMFPRPSGATKIAFVTYASKQALDKALEISHSLGGVELNVTKALPKSARGQPAPVPPEAKSEARVFVGQLPATATEDEVIGYFSKFGTITRVHFPPTQPQEKGRIYGFVTFSSPQEKFACLSANHVFKGVEIRVVEAVPKGVAERPRVSLPPPAPVGAPSMPPIPGQTGEFDENPVRIFVGRLPLDTTPEELRDYFARYGTIVDVFMPGRGKPGGGKSDAKGGGFAFITYSHSRELFKALADVPHTFKDVTLDVVEARPKGVPGPGPASSAGPAASSQAEPRVFVGRISSELTDAQLRDYFASFGRVVDVYRPKQHSKDGFDFAFVIFSSQQEVARVLAEDKHIVAGKFELNVIRARPRNALPGEPHPGLPGAPQWPEPPGRGGGRGREFGDDIYAPHAAGRGPVPGYSPVPVDPAAYLGPQPGYEMYPPQPPQYSAYPSPPAYDPYGAQPPVYGVPPPPSYGSVPAGYGAAPSASAKHQRYAPY